MESHIPNLTNYFREHQLNLNSKTEFICFSKQNDQRNKTQDTILGDKNVIEKSNECKHLGLTIDINLCLMNRVQQILKKMGPGIKTVGSLETQLPTSGLENLLLSIVLSHFN